MKGVCQVHGTITLSYDTKTETYYCSKCKSAKIKRKKRAELKEKAVKYKGGKCCKCGYSKSLGALEFHHINPEEKDFNISKYGVGKSWELVKEELDKCILLCSNCHREIHSI